MGQEKVFRVTTGGGRYFCSRDTVTGTVYSTYVIVASALETYDVAAALASRLIEAGHDAEVCDISGRPVGPGNDRSGNVSDKDLTQLWGPERTAQPAKQ
jgi:hypothetical protein